MEPKYSALFSSRDVEPRNPDRRLRSDDCPRVVDDEVNAEIFNNWDAYREHVRERRSFNNDDTLLDRGKDGRTDGLFCRVERYERGSGVTAKCVVTVDA
jgi:hypothetical protein